MHLLKAFLKSACLAALFIAMLVGPPANSALATHYFFDVNGTATGSGAADGGSYSWESAVWDATAGGTGTPIVWPDGNNFPEFAAGTDASGKGYTVTVNANQTFAGMALIASGGSTTNKFVTVGAANNSVLTLFTNTGGQGIFVGGTADQNLVISAPIAGDASTPVVWQGPISGTTPGSLYLYGNNTFGGGVDLNTTAGLNFNNNNSFGTGPIRWGFTGGTTTQFTIAAPAAAAPLTIANPVQTKAASTLVMATFAKPVTWSGPWSLATGLSTLDVHADATTTISGIIGGTDGTSALTKVSPGALTLSGANTYAGGTTISGGTVELSGASASLGTGSVTVTGLGTSLAVDSGVANAIGNAATLNLGGFATMSLGSGVNDRISTLILDGTQQPNGTYGSSQSNAVNKLDFYFTGTGIVTVGPSILAGDFNNNGVVDAADYVAWRNNVGQPSQTLPNDTTGVIIGNAQYNLWRSNFGNTVPAPGAGSSISGAVVPEPSTMGLLMLSLATLGGVNKVRGCNGLSQLLRRR